MSESASALVPSRPRVHFFVTGFGPFAGVTHNPTSALAAALAGHADASAGVVVSLAEVVETSGAAADALSARIGAAAAAIAAPDVVVLLHFGVAAGSPGFELERIAVNDATFRVPDERGWQPRGELVDADAPPGGKQTSIAIVDVARRLTATAVARNPVAVSDDAGRFLCNYLFYRSLATAERLNAGAAAGSARFHVLFVHCPTHDVEDAAAQVRFALALLRELAASVRHEHANGDGDASAAPVPRVRTRPPAAVAGGDAAAAAAAAVAAAKDGDVTLVAPAALAAADGEGERASAGGEERDGSPAPPRIGCPPGVVRSANGGAEGTADAAPPAPPLLLRQLLELGFPHALSAAAAAASESLEAAAEWVLAALDAGGPADGGAGGALGGGGDATPSASPLSPAAAPFESAATAAQRTKLVVVVRSDLGMSPGKVAAQVAHGALGATRRCGVTALERWRDDGEPIVVLRCGDLGALDSLRAAAAAEGLPTSTVRDAGRTQVEPGSVTVLAIGPAAAHRVDRVTGGLRLM